MLGREEVDVEFVSACEQFLLFVGQAIEEEDPKTNLYQSLKEGKFSDTLVRGSCIAACSRVLLRLGMLSCRLDVASCASRNADCDACPEVNNQGLSVHRPFDFLKINEMRAHTHTGFLCM